MLSHVNNKVYTLYNTSPGYGRRKLAMRVSEGTIYGRFAELYNSEMFQEHEEVIIFTRDEFNRTYSSMQEVIDHINKIDMQLNQEDDWKLMGYWPKIMAKVYLLDTNMGFIFEKEHLQCYLDTYLYNRIGNSKKKSAESEENASIKL